MHDLDRTQLEVLDESGLEPELAEQGGAPADRRRAGAPATDVRMDAAEEIELATELLEVGNEQELEHFLGALVARVGRAAGGALRSDTGRALIRILRGAARRALPVVGRGIGQWVAPGRGATLSAAAGRLAGRMLGLELEGLSHEDREFEIARQLVRFSAAAVRRAAVGPAGDPVEAARRAAAAAARTYAPGLLRPRGSGSARTGRWTRNGRFIVLHLES